MASDDGLAESGVSPGNILIKEEEYQRLVQAAALAGVSWGTPPNQPTPTAQPQGSGSSEPILVGSSDAPSQVGDESPSMPPISSASESGSPVTRRHLQISLNRTKRGFIQVSEHLREKLKQTKQALDEEKQCRLQEAPTLRKLLDDRVDMLTPAFHSAIGVLREDLNTLMPLQEKVEELEGQLRTVKNSVKEALEHSDQVLQELDALIPLKRSWNKEPSRSGATGRSWTMRSSRS